LEVRSPDPSANPYMLMTAIMAAGVDGVKRKLTAPPPVKENVYLQSAEWREKHNIRELPGSLEEALDALEADEVIQGVFSRHTIDHYLASKRAEVHEYKKAVHSWELENYLTKY
jgi:glutamine synthetase